MDNDTPPPGIRPLMHEPNRLWPWVFRQHQVWVDINGSEHEIESMPLDYVDNVIGFCIRRAMWIYLLVAESDDDGDLSDWHAAADDRNLIIRRVEWLEATPLMRALRRWVELQGRPRFSLQDSDRVRLALYDRQQFSPRQLL